MDRRIAKTQRALVQSLGDCLTKHRWEDISVQLLCNTADVSRSTFYAHFDSKQDLMVLAMTQMSKRLVTDSHERRSLTLNRRISILPALLRHMRDHLFLFQTTSKSMAGHALANHFETMVGQLIQAEIEGSPLSKTITERQVKFLVGGVFAVLDDWRENRCTETDQDILAELDQSVDLVLSSQI